MIASMYQDYHDILTERAQFLLKEKDDRYYRYYPLKKVMKMLEKGMELYSLNQDIQPRRIISIEERGLQMFHEVTTYKGANIWMGEQMQILVDTFWLPLPEIEFHEPLYEYDMMYDRFFETYITSIRPLGKRMWAFKFTSEDNSGTVINNLIVRTPTDEILSEKSAWEQANEEILLLR